MEGSTVTALGSLAVHAPMPVRMTGCRLAAPQFSTGGKVRRLRPPRPFPKGGKRRQRWLEARREEARREKDKLALKAELRRQRKVDTKEAAEPRRVYSDDSSLIKKNAEVLWRRFCRFKMRRLGRMLWCPAAAKRTRSGTAREWADAHTVAQVRPNL